MNAATIIKKSAFLFKREAKCELMNTRIYIFEIITDEKSLHETLNISIGQEATLLKL